MAIVIDSDRKAPGAKINETKKRIISEFSDHGDPAWLTAGREIENYIPAENISKALSTIYPSFLDVESTDRYQHRLHFFEVGKARKIRTEVDKVKVARLVCDGPPNLDVYDLRMQVNKIVSMIKKANS